MTSSNPDAKIIVMASDYQEKVIANYYANLDAIMLARLGELVTDLYLAETPAKADRLWKRVQKAMTNLKIPPPITDHIMKQRNVEILAKNLKDWLTTQKKR